MGFKQHSAKKGNAGYFFSVQCFRNDKLGFPAAVGTQLNGAVIQDAVLKPAFFVNDIAVLCFGIFAACGGFGCEGILQGGRDGCGTCCKDKCEHERNSFKFHGFSSFLDGFLYFVWHAALASLEYSIFRKWSMEAGTAICGNAAVVTGHGVNSKPAVQKADFRGQSKMDFCGAHMV